MVQINSYYNSIKVEYPITDTNYPLCNTTQYEEAINQTEQVQEILARSHKLDLEKDAV